MAYDYYGPDDSNGALNTTEGFNSSLYGIGYNNARSLLFRLRITKKRGHAVWAKMDYGRCNISILFFTKRMTQNDGFLAVGSRGNDIDARAADFFDAF